MKMEKTKVGSTSVWDMTFKRIFFGWVWLSISLLSPADVLPVDFIRDTLGAVPPERRLVLEAEEQSVAAAMLGTRRFKSTVSYWQKNGQRIWVLQARGKVNLIDAGLVVEQGRVVKGEVLVFRESRGHQICSDRFLKQLKGLFFKKNGKLNRKVDGYSGATYSVNAVRKMARLALYLDSLAQPAKE